MSSPGTGWVTVALLGKTRGNRGEVTAIPLSSKPERFEQLKQVYLAGPSQDGPAEVEFTWFHSGGLIFKFRGIDTITDAERLAGSEVRIPESERTSLEEGEFFHSDLIGCELIDRRTGESLGRVRRFDDSGGAGWLIGEGDLMVPFARQICVEIDLAARRIAVELPEGLKDLNRS